MFDEMYKNEKLKKMFKAYGLDDKDLVFIKEQITAQGTLTDTVSPSLVHPMLHQEARDRILVHNSRNKNKNKQQQQAVITRETKLKGVRTIYHTIIYIVHIPVGNQCNFFSSDLVMLHHLQNEASSYVLKSLKIVERAFRADSYK